VWRIDDPPLASCGQGPRWALVDGARRAVLEALVAAGDPVWIAHADDPVDEEVPGNWTRAAGPWWRLPPDLDLDDRATKAWLHSLGNWTAHAAPAPVAPPGPDAFRTAPEALLGWMRQNAVSALVVATPDSTEWLVAVAPREHP
jgi:hypothetical protein